MILKSDSINQYSTEYSITGILSTPRQQNNEECVGYLI